MVFFIIIFFIAISGIISVFWLLRSEKPIAPSKQKIEQTEKINMTGKLLLDRVGLSPKELDDDPANDLSQPPKSLISKLTSLFIIPGKKEKEEDIPEATPFPMLKDYLKSDENRKREDSLSKAILKSDTAEPETGTASIITNKQINTPEQNPNIPTEESQNNDNADNLSIKEKEDLENEIDTSIELTELKQKYEKIDKMLKEKSSELEKAQNSLNIELNNRKDFNKVKDILEKELKEVRNEARKLKVEITSSETEGESYKKRVNQLEEKIKKLELSNLNKEDQLKKFNKAPEANTKLNPPEDKNLKEEIKEGSVNKDDKNNSEPTTAKLTNNFNLNTNLQKDIDQKIIIENRPEEMTPKPETPKDTNIYENYTKKDPVNKPPENEQDTYQTLAPDITEQKEEIKEPELDIKNKDDKQENNRKDNKEEETKNNKEE